MTIDMFWPYCAAFVFGGFLSVTLTMPILRRLGFVALGVRGGTVAAVWQSHVGNVPKNSLYCSLQSTGSLGLSITQKLFIFFLGGAFAMWITYLLIFIIFRSHINITELEVPKDEGFMDSVIAFIMKGLRDFKKNWKKKAIKKIARMELEAQFPDNDDIED